MTNTESIIRPILVDTYDSCKMTDALIEHLAECIDSHTDGDPDIYGDDQREAMITRVCWDWYSGGTTAACVAKQIEAALREA